MSKQGAEQTLEGWMPVASNYAEYIDPITSLYAEKALEMLPVHEGDAVLDVAAGAGALAIPAAQKDAEVMAVDFTPPLIDILQEKAQEKKLDNLTAKVMDGQDLKLEDDSFDAAYSVFGLMLFADRDKGFSELKRVLSPGGKAMVVTWDAPPNNDWLEIFQGVIQTAFPDMPRLAPPAFIELADKERLASEMSDAGFKDVEIKSWATSSSWEDADTAWQTIAKANPIFTPLMEKIGPQGASHLRRVFDEKIKERFGNGPVEINATAHFAVGTA